jgi:multidrug efflux system outer membrane protein
MGSRPSFFTKLLGVSALSVLSGCLVKPDYEQPKVLTDAPYMESVVSQETIANLPWWAVFDDSNLQTLIRKALAENRDLKVAMARIDEARGLLGVARPDQFPRLDIAGNATRVDGSDEAIVPRGINDDLGLYSKLSFEVDLWGRYASATEAQRAQLLSSEYAYRAVTILLVSQVATAYLQLQNVDRQIEISEHTLKNRHDATVLNDQRFKGGYVGLLDVNQAQIQEEEARAALIALTRAGRLIENALSVLMGEVPHSIVRSPSKTGPIAIEALPAGVPAMLLERRPDVKAAEEQARAAVMRIGVARAQQYPALSLTGFLGLNSTDRTNLFNGDARTWNIGAGLLGPLVDLGKSWSRVDAAEAQAQQALQSYEGAVLQAVREVEDSLVSVRTFKEEHRARAAQVKAGQSAAFLSRRRYMDGVTSYLEVLDTERSLFNAELAHSNTQERYLNAIVQLYRSLGGGWNPEGKDASTSGAADRQGSTPK